MLLYQRYSFKGNASANGAFPFLGGRSLKITLPELETFEWWISGLMLDPLFFLISRLNNACSPLVINLQINYPIGIKDTPF